MEYNNLTPLVCINNTKDACLYFDKIVPLNLAQLIPWENNEDAEAFDILNKILPPCLLDSEHPTGLGPMMLLYIDTYVEVYPASIGIKEFQDRKISSQRAKRLAPLLFSASTYLIESLPEPVNSIFGVSDLSDNNMQTEDPAFILTGLNLINTEGISWRHILAIRENQESLKKLRQLRTFIFETYKDKPITFIKDDILNRIDMYEATAREWGLKTKESVLKIIFNSGNAISVTAATIASAFSGMPISISLPLGIGSTFLIGNIALQIGSHKKELHHFKQENPITYLIDLKNENK